MAKHSVDPSRRLAQHTLAFEFVALAHSYEEAQDIQERQKTLFEKGSTTEMIIAGAPSVRLKAEEVWDQPLTRVLHKMGLAPSTGAAGRAILNGGLYLGSVNEDEIEWTQVAPLKASLQRSLTKDDAAPQSTSQNIDVILVRMGKTNVCALQVMSS